MLVIGLSSCATPPAPIAIDPPSFDIVRPDRPHLEDVEITCPVPESLLRNLNVLVAYALQLEDYIDGTDQYIELVKIFLSPN